MKKDSTLLTLNALSLASPPEFPKIWTRVLDEVVPSFVKEEFSPQESWRNKPFDQNDVKFFSKGLLELSDFFTEDRQGAKLPNYFTTARFRSSYFLYFFGLQGAKFLTLFERYPKAIEAALNHAAETGTFRVIDVGSGPGTASIAFLAFLLEGLVGDTNKAFKLPFKIELVWIDQNDSIMHEGERLVHKMIKLFPNLEGEIEIKREGRSWWKHPKEFKFEASLVLFGNVLNETGSDPRIFQQGLAPFFKNPKGGGVLIMEPAFRSSSQRVSQIRDEIVTADPPLPLWGPCLHTGLCPLANGRDWCHFSVKAELPGKFFRKFSISLGGIREWLKFSFIWVASRESVKEAAPHKGLVRVVSDTLKGPSGQQNQICTPERISYVKSEKRPYYRGEVIRDSVLQPSDSKTRNRKSIR